MSAVTVELARGLHELARRPVPLPEVATRALLHALARAIGSSRSAPVGLLVDHFTEHGGTGVVPVLGRRERLDVLAATVVHGTAAALGAGRGQTDGPVAPEASTMAAAASLGYAEQAGGRTVLTAFVLGCETQARLARALAPRHHELGWDARGVCAPMGAAVAASVVLGLDPDGIAGALGIAASQTLGQREDEGTATAAFLPGKGAANGVHAALLAQAGLSGPLDALEHPRGYLAVLSPGTAPPEIDDLGSRWLWSPAAPGDEDLDAEVEQLVDPVLDGRVPAFVESVTALHEAPSLAALFTVGSEETAA